MPSLTLNLSNVADLEAIPAGVYEAKIFEVKQTKSKAGNPMLNVVFSITAGEYAEQRIFHNLTLVEQSMPFVKRFLRAFFTKEQLNVEEFTLDTEDMIGRDCRIRLAREKYEGDWQNKVKAVVRPEDESAAFESVNGDSESLFDIDNE